MNDAETKGDSMADGSSDKMLIGVETRVLFYEYPSKEHTKSTLTICNNGACYAAFKIKTTSPRQYSVKPTMGLLIPHSSITVTISLAAPPENISAASEKCKDKFLVVCKRIDEAPPSLQPAEMSEYINNFWHSLKNEKDSSNEAHKEHIFEMRIRSEIKIRVDKVETGVKRQSHKISQDNHDLQSVSASQDLNTFPNHKHPDPASHQPPRRRNVSSAPDSGSLDTPSRDHRPFPRESKDTSAQERSSQNRESLRHPQIAKHASLQASKRPSLCDFFRPPAVYWIMALCSFFFYIGIVINRLVSSSSSS